MDFQISTQKGIGVGLGNGFGLIGLQLVDMILKSYSKLRLVYTHTSVIYAQS